MKENKRGERIGKKRNKEERRLKKIKEEERGARRGEKRKRRY